MIRRRCFQSLFLLVSLAILAGLTLGSCDSNSPSPPGPATVGLLLQEPTSVPSFAEVSTFFGPWDISSTWGVSWSDIDSDGDVDFYAAVHMHFPSKLWTNHDGQYLVRTETSLDTETGLDDHKGLWTDYDGDGDPDLYSVNGYYRKDRMFRNEGDYSFQDVTEEAGTIFGDFARGRSAIAGDMTGNGFDDILVTNLRGPDLFYRNLQGRFEECAISHGLSNSFNTVGAVSGDLDSDGDIDLFIPVWNRTAANLLLLNRGDGVFVERSTGSGADILGVCMTAALGDVDADGDLDILVTRAYGGGHVLLQNNGNAKFLDVSDKAGIGLTGKGLFNTGFADLDNDGDLDLVITSSGDSAERNGDDVVFRNHGDGTFENVSDRAGIQTSIRGNATAVAFADYDLDGFLDFVVSNGWGVREIGGPLLLYRNRGLPASQEDAGHWLSLRTERDYGSRNGNGPRVQPTSLRAGLFPATRSCGRISCASTGSCDPRCIQCRMANVKTPTALRRPWNAYAMHRCIVVFGFVVPAAVFHAGRRFGERIGA